MIALSNVYLLDATLIDNGVKLVFINSDGEILEIVDEIPLYGYIMPRDDVNPYTLARDLENYGGVMESYVEEWFLPPYYDSKKPVVVFKTRNPVILENMVRETMVKNIGLRVNEYPPPLIEALWRISLQPLTRYRVVGGEYVVGEDPVNPLYEEPPVKYVELKLFKNNVRALSSSIFPDHASINVNGSVEYSGSVDKVVEQLAELDYHILYTSFIERNYLTTIYPEVFSGKKFIWINDTLTPVSHSGVVYWSRLSYTPLRMMNSVTIGRVLTTLEALEARVRRYMLIKGFGRREVWRKLRELGETDRGGAVFAPRPGLYWGVCQIDFSSLYPSIIVRYNISGETVNKPYCVESVKPPGSRHGVCMDSPGIVPSVLEKLIGFRELLRDAYRKTGLEVYRVREKALKWILVAGFGYLGYRNSFFGSINAHEVVTSVARYLAYETARILGENGYRVIHFLVDSVFVETRDCSRVLDLIMGTGFKAKVEAEYVWLYIPRTLNRYGASNRYIGKLVDGELKIKGVYMVRRNTPQYIREVQEKALRILGEADNPIEMSKAIKIVDDLFRSAEADLVNNNVDPWKLVMTVESRAPEKLGIVGDHYGHNTIVQHIVAPGGRRVQPWDALTYDHEYYVELLWKARRELPCIDDVKTT